MQDAACKSVLLCALALATLVASGCAQFGGGRRAEARHQPTVIVANVGNSGIARAELSHWTHALPATATGLPAEEVRKRVLSFLIFSRWMREEARELGVTVPTDKVEREAYELAADQRENVRYEGLPNVFVLRQLLTHGVLTRADRVWLLRLALLVPKVEGAWTVRARQAISREQIQRFYTAHRLRFWRPAERDVEIIGASQSTVREAKREIESGQPFLTVARRVSLDPEAPGGLWRLVRGHDEPQVEDPIFGAELHVLRGPRHYSLFYVFEVLNAVPAHWQTLAEAASTIRSELAPSLPRLFLTFVRKWTARTACRAGFVVLRCHEYSHRRRARPAVGPARR
jgi:hypothetical protein